MLGWGDTQPHGFAVREGVTVLRLSMLGGGELSVGCLVPQQVPQGAAGGPDDSSAFPFPSLRHKLVVFS